MRRHRQELRVLQEKRFQLVGADDIAGVAASSVAQRAPKDSCKRWSNDTPAFLKM